MNLKYFTAITIAILILTSAVHADVDPPTAPQNLRILNSSSNDTLNVPVTVKETAGVGTNGYPIDVVVPLAKGKFSNVDHFRIANDAGTTVDAQFNVLNRWIDGSIRHVKVHFQPTVTAYTGASGSGTRTYYLKNDGSGNSGTDTDLNVTETTETITVQTGASGVKFTIDKDQFTIFDQVWMDTDGDGLFKDETPIITSNSSNGGVVDGLWAGVQQDSARTDITYTVEESGPMRVVIKAEAPTLYYGSGYDGSDSNHVHGLAVRIYAYAGKPFVKVDYQLQNGAKNSKWAWPLYFDYMDINFSLNMNPVNMTVRADMGDGNVSSGSLSSYTDGAIVKVIGPQMVVDNVTRDTPDMILKLEEGDGTPISPDWEIDETSLFSNPAFSTFLDVDDGTKGVAVTMRNFWQMWPNGLYIDDTGKLSVQMWPSWLCFWNDDGGIIGWQGNCKNESYPARLGYWLFDTQFTYKEAMFYFHNTGTSNATLQNWAKTVQFYPVGTIATSHYQNTAASLDMGGMIPIDTKLSTTDERRPTYTSKDFDLGPKDSYGHYKFGWNQFYFEDKTRKHAPNTTGDQPDTAAALIVTENPSDYWNALDHSMASLNITPYWIGGSYNYSDDWDLLRLQSSQYPLSNIRAKGAPAPANMDAPWLTGSYLMNKARDDAHGWFYHVGWSYFLTGNYWIKDWYHFIAEFRKSTLSHPTHSGGQSRAVGHHLGSAFLAYQITGDTEILDLIQNYIKSYLRPSNTGGTDPGGGVALQDAQYGHIPFVSGDDMPYMMSFLIRQIMSYMDEIKDTDPQAFAEAFQFLSGQIDANINYLNWEYRCDPIEGLNHRSEECASNSASAYILADPVSWYYVITGKRAVLSNLKDYLDDGINGGSYPRTSKYTDWSDQFTGRWTKFVLENEPIRNDRTGPIAITNLVANENASTGEITLSYTAPSDAARYHVVYSDKPISETTNPSTSVSNWWAGGVVGALSKITTFMPETLPDCQYVAVFTFDSDGNMSRMSNVAQIAQ
jgi:hypothetical protein